MTLNNENIYSKKETGVFPKSQQIIDLIEA
ncbi:hypothetical protein F7732_04035 [Bacillus mesophilum]|uniref:Uncharacterized protein n=1 Tax=Bacillus mesophilum TaxID=1071718 RepID=A0A7V7RQL3_9BACI|nr:hypothetical protein F7732_04035 [Bacillus mesophilum]